MMMMMMMVVITEQIWKNIFLGQGPVLDPCGHANKNCSFVKDGELLQ
jgi:hypothetical protein